MVKIEREFRFRSDLRRESVAVCLLRIDEDDGSVVTFVADANAQSSGEVIIIDAKNFAAGPIARVQIPQRVPTGFHSIWIPGDQMRA